MFSAKDKLITQSFCRHSHPAAALSTDGTAMAARTGWRSLSRHLGARDGHLMACRKDTRGFEDCSSKVKREERKASLFGGCTVPGSPNLSAASLLTASKRPRGWRWPFASERCEETKPKIGWNSAVTFASHSSFLLARAKVLVSRRTVYTHLQNGQIHQACYKTTYQRNKATIRS